MNELISQIASKAGMDESTTEKGIGALLATVKQHAPEGVFSSIADVVPNSDSILSKFQSIPDNAENGIGSGLMGMASNLLGGNSEQITTMISMFSKGGFSLDMVKQFLPAVFGYFQNNGSTDVVEKIGQVIPGLSELMSASESGRLLNKISNFF